MAPETGNELVASSALTGSAAMTSINRAMAG